MTPSTTPAYTTLPAPLQPYLREFFVKADDCKIVKGLKLQILTGLALHGNSIDTVLREVRSYVRSHDTWFVVKAVEAVGRIACMGDVEVRFLFLGAGAARARAQKQNKITGGPLRPAPIPPSSPRPQVTFVAAV